MTRTAVMLATWTLLAGAGIPLIGVLNGGMARAVGSPVGATAVMFAVAFLAAAALAVPLRGLPTPAQLAAAPAGSWGAGLLIGFYALSATVILPRFGAGNLVAFILVAQLVTAALVDRFGLFGMARQPLDLPRIGGLVLILAGIALTQLAGAKPPAS